jgi:hypothetical protein
MQPIPLLKHRRFDPEVVDGMSAAYATVCHALGLNTKPDPATEIVALKIIEIATRGARSPTEIHLLAMEELRDAGTGGPSLADHLADLRQAKHRNRVPSSGGGLALRFPVAGKAILEDLPITIREVRSNHLIDGGGLRWVQLFSLG